MPRPALTPQQLARVEALRGVGAGRTLVILGTGPSVNQAPIERLVDHPTIDLMSVNRPDERVHPTRYWAIGDPKPAIRYRARMLDYPGQALLSTATWLAGELPGAIYLNSLAGKGWSRELTKGYFIGKSTVYANLQTAMWMGYEHTYCFGVDMRPDAEQLWCYGDNPDAVPERRRAIMAQEASHYAWAAEHALSPGERARIVFCSEGVNPWPFLQSFPRLKPETAVDTILDLIGPSEWARMGAQYKLKQSLSPIPVKPREKHP